MVSTSSAAAQSSENEKRRKQTMEKAKANHLSRQLQMRLQYARLKVEHGWQKQNLNEVENLYFHSSHLRGSKPLPTTLATVQQQQPSFPIPSTPFSQSSISFRLGSSTLSRNIVNTNTVNERNASLVSQENTSIHSDSPTICAPDTSPTPNTNPSIISDQPHDPAVMIVDSQKETSAVSTTNSVPAPLSGPALDIDMISGASPVPASSLSPLQGSQSPVDPASSSVNHYQSVKPSRPRTQKIPSGSKSAPSLTARDMFNFGSTSTLTYDSFWSSHSGSTTPRPPRPSGGADHGNNYLLPGDYSSAVPDLGRHSNADLTSLSSLPPQQ